MQLLPKVSLSTAIIHILDYEDNCHKCRTLLDNGSQIHFITEKMANKSELRQRELEIFLGGVNQMSWSVIKITNTKIQLRSNKYSACVAFSITSKMNEYIPSKPISRVALEIPSKIYLPDAEFNIFGSIDVLIGAKIILKLLCTGK